MSRAIDSIITYRILSLLVTPFEDTDAYKLGIIDKNGKELKSMGQLNTVQERDAYTLLHRLVFRLKKIIEKVPIENKRLLSFAAALSLIKEEYEVNRESLDLEFKFSKSLNNVKEESLIIVENFLNNKYIVPFRLFKEELAGNAVGRGAIAGIGVGLEGEPGLKTTQMKKYKDRNKKNAPSSLLRRKMDV